MNINIIKYNDIEIGLPTPFVTLERDHIFNGQKLGNVDKIKLIGQLTGKYSDLTGYQQILINNFNQDFKNFKILEYTPDPYEIKMMGGTINIVTGYYREISPNIFENMSLGLFPKKPIINKGDDNLWYLNFFTGTSYISAYSSTDLINWNIENNEYVTAPAPSGQLSKLKTIYEKNNVIVNSINFKEGVYNGILDYEINLIAKDFNYNVQNPVNQFTINKQNNILNLNHNVSAQGINTSSTNCNALNNAINFVNQFTGLKNIPNLYSDIDIGLPDEILITGNIFYDGKYIKNYIDNKFYWTKIDEPSISIFRPNEFGNTNWVLFSTNPEHPAYINPSTNKEVFPLYNWDSLNISINSGEFILLEQKESINRIDGIYSIQESYIKDLHSDHANYGILKYTTEYNSGAEQDVVNFSIKGQYSDSAINGDFDKLKSRFNSDIKPNLFSKLNGNINSFYNGYINPTALSYSINENSGAHSIDFQFEYDNLSLPNPYISYTSNISRDEISQIININLNADIIVRGGSLASRYAIAQSNYSNAVNALSDVAKYLYTGFVEFNRYNFSYPLRLIKLDTKDNKSLGKISLSATFDDKETPYNAAEADYSVNRQLPVWYFGQNPTLLKNNYIFQDFDILTPLRSTYDINVKTKEGIAEMQTGLGQEIFKPSEGEIINKKFNYQKDKEGRIRNMKANIEIISKEEKSIFPKNTI
jgi:hypothetical protein